MFTLRLFELKYMFDSVVAFKQYIDTKSKKLCSTIIYHNMPIKIYYRVNMVNYHNINGSECYCLNYRFVQNQYLVEPRKIMTTFELQKKKKQY